MHGFDRPTPADAAACICRFWATTNTEMDWHYNTGNCPYGSEVK